MSLQNQNNPRAFYEGPLEEGSSIVLDEGEMHHLKRVLRLTKEETIEIVNGQGFLASVRFEEPITLCSVAFFPPPPQKILVQPLLESAHLELVFEKATELGITHFYLFPAQKSKERSLFPSKEARLKKIRISALKQCRRLYLPEVILFPHKEALPELPSHLYLADPDGTFLTPNKTAPSAIIVGPESGFTKEEKEFWLHTKKASPIRLSDGVLRAETASILSAALLSLQ